MFFYLFYFVHLPFIYILRSGFLLIFIRLCLPPPSIYCLVTFSLIFLLPSTFLLHHFISCTYLWPSPIYCPVPSSWYSLPSVLSSFVSLLFSVFLLHQFFFCPLHCSIIIFCVFAFSLHLYFIKCPPPCIHCHLCHPRSFVYCSVPFLFLIYFLSGIFRLFFVTCLFLNLLLFLFLYIPCRLCLPCPSFYCHVPFS